MGFVVFAVLSSCNTLIVGLLSGRNERWPRRMLPPGELRWVCVALSIKVRKRRERKTDARSLHYAHR